MTRPGSEIDGDAKTELDHFGNCPFCGALIDMRDLAQVTSNQVHPCCAGINSGFA
jgi:hypothetical protein